MKIDIITIFPRMFDQIFEESMIGRARKNGILDIKIHNLRDFSENKHRIVDDRPFGGGSGMVLKAEPVYKAVGYIKKVTKKLKSKIIFLSPQGKALNNKVAIDLSKEKHLIFICAHYEGVDERVMKLIDSEISIGDYVLTGGELPAMVVVDAIARFMPGVIKENESVEKDSFFNGLLDYPHYTRPRIFKKAKVPDVLLSGNHKEIEKWRKKQSFKNTLLKRPELFKNKNLTEEEIKLVKELKKEQKND
ncbi:MAG: tRNA (guanosine(37)-N1)-methyltransferase TrmD [Elusimicrobia bacterium RIFOXYA2_FULL_39_19]|nr:MAG: tRNA (guanosine(37)-N1)-methyltransferase TrmD [Elusimicrobia bacterium RIFOXYA2_FULL_39_19]